MIKDKLLITGMSPGNGYFKQEVIDKLLVYCMENYSNIGVFIPDVPAISTYIALGYSEDKARSKKAIPQGNNFRNKIKNSIKDKELSNERIRVFDWEKELIEENSDYKKSFSYVKSLYDDNNSFHEDINLETKKVLENNPFRKKDLNIKDIEIGTHYILSEFAFMLFISENMLNYEKCIYGYHRPWSVFVKFIEGEYDGKVKDRLEFLLLPDFSK